MLAKRIAVNTIISAGARVIGILLAFLIIGLITRYLTKTEWGEYSIILTFGGIGAVLADMGFYQLMVREISKPDSDEKRVVSNIFTLRLISGLFIFAAAPLASLLFPYSGQARLGIVVGMIGFWFLADSQVLMGLFQKYLQMDKVAMAELAGRVIQLFLTWIFIKLGYSFLFLVSALTISGLVNFLLIYWWAREHCKLRLSFDWPYWKKILAQSYPLAIASVLVMIYFSSDSLFLSALKPAADVGVYRLSYKILESLIFFPAMFVGLIMPLLANSAKFDPAKFKNIFQRGSDVLMIFAVPLVLATFILSPALINLLGGGQYSESAPILNILIIAVGVIFFGTLFSYVLIALEKQKSLLWISAVGAVFNVAANLILIPRYSYYAAAATTVATEALVAILMAIAIWRFFHWLPSFKIIFKCLLSSLIMVAALWLLSGYNLGLLFVVAIVMYFSALYLLRGFSKAEVLDLVRREEGKI